MNAVGTNTAQSTRAVATMGPVTSLIACLVASEVDNPRAILRSTFSTTTMASSTTIPMASTRPKRERALMLKPRTSMTAKVPTRDTGTAARRIIEARQVCRKRMTTRTTSRMASRSV